MKDYFEIKATDALKLSEFKTSTKPTYASEEDYAAQLEGLRGRLEEYQTLLYAGHAQSILIVFQGMDTSGKDGAIKHVMSGINPQGCSVISFKAPTKTELAHDFLWRTTRVLPERGQIGIFNRSYYEETLITRVHPELLEAENLPGKDIGGEDFWKFRYHDILHYEKYLHRQGVEIVKIFIHISKDEQKRRLLARFEDEKKLWKIDEGDIRERAFWDEYQKAYAECLGQTSSKSCPWYIVPGDDKKNARLSVARILTERFAGLNLTYPKVTEAQKKKLVDLKAVLEEKG